MSTPTLQGLFEDCVRRAEERVRASPEFKAVAEEVERQIREEGSNPGGPPLVGLEGVAVPWTYPGLNTGIYRMWRACAGNAKARRRWRRRLLPNSQRQVAIERERAATRRWCEE